MGLFLDKEELDRIKRAFSEVKEAKKNGNFSREEAIKLLASKNDMTNDEKNFVFSFFYPRPLLDMELPIRVAKSRTSRKVSRCSDPNLIDVGLILEASQTQQYSRFLYHLFYAFSTNADFLFRKETGELGESTCPICGRKLCGFNNWDKNKDKEASTIAVCSEKSSVVLCKNCLSHLNAAKELIQQLDPEFFRYG